MKAKIIASTNHHRKWLKTSNIHFINQMVGENNLVYTDLSFLPGEGLDFHKHPNQTEVLHLIEGSLEMWIGQHKSILNEGTTIVLLAGQTHACFNVSSQEVRIFSVLSSEQPLGFEIIDQSERAPWKSLR